MLEGEGAPNAAHWGHSSLWHLSDVAEWIASADLQIKGACVAEAQIDLARTTMAVNLAASLRGIQQTAEVAGEGTDAEVPEALRCFLSDDALKQIA